MKKIIGAFVIVIAAMFFVQLTQYTPVGQIEYNGYVVGNIDIAKTLMSEEVQQDVLELSKVVESDNIYHQLVNYYYGDEKSLINFDYPLFFNDNLAMYFLKDGGRLIDTDFNDYEVKKDTVLTQGDYFDKTVVQKDAETYVLYSMENGLYINSLPLTIYTETKNTVLPANSIIYFQENIIQYFELKEDKLVFHSISDIDKNTKIAIKEELITYRNFLLELGIITEKKQVVVENPKEETVKKPIITTTPPPVVIKPDDVVTVPNENNGNENNGNYIEGEYKYYKPTVENAPYTSTVYSLSSSIKIIDPQGHIEKNRVEIQVWQQGKVYMRKYIKKSQSFTLTGLEPDSKYTIYTKYNYEKENGDIEEVELQEYTIRTNKVSDLDDINIDYINGDIFATQLEVKDIKVQGNLENEALTNISKLSVVANDVVINMSSTHMSNLKTGVPFTYKSPTRLNSNTPVEYKIVAYDRFGNEFNIEQPMLKTKTCKKAPTAIIKPAINKVSLITLKISLDNPDNVDLKNYRLVISDLDGNILKEEVVTSDTYTYEDLDAGKVLNAVLYADYDVENDLGIQKNQTLANVQVISVPLSSLGKISTKTDIVDTTKNSIDFDFSIDRKQTNERLIQLTDSIELTVTSNDGQVFKYKLNDEEVLKVKNKSSVPIHFDNLVSKMEYSIKVDIVVKHGTTDYNYQCLNNIDLFKTMRTPLEIQIKNVVINESSIELETRAIDEDGAAVDGYVGVRVKDSAQNVLDVFLVNTVTGGSEGWKKYRIDKLDSGDYYTFQFYSVEYNEGYTLKTREYNKEIFKISYDIPKGITGNITVGTIKENPDKYESLVEIVYSLRGSQTNILEKMYYFEVYKDDELYNTYEYYMGDVIAVDNVTRPVTLQLPPESDYVVNLYVYDTLNKDRVNLGSTTFNTDREWDTISSVNEFYTKINAKPNGNYYVLKDINLGTIYDESGSISKAFTGHIDFQGNKLTANIKYSGGAIFSKNAGIIENIVFNIEFTNNDVLEKVGGLVYINADGGQIDNIMVNFNGTSSYAHDGLGGIIYENQNGASLSNFVVYANQSLHTKHKSSYVVATNNGKIFDGYVTGAHIDGTYPNELLYDVDNSGNFNTEDYFKQVGGICGENQVDGIVERVYSTTKVLRADTKAGPNPDSLIGSNEEDSIGNVIGLNRGIARNMFSYGDGNYKAAYAAYGPTVGRNRNGVTVNNESYYISDFKHNDDRLNKRVTKLMMYDEDFHTTVLNNGEVTGAFNINNVLLKYYPHINLPAIFPLQKFVELPVVDSSESIDIKSSKVISSTDTSAVVEVMLNNPGNGDLKNITMENVDRVKILSFVHENKSTRVMIEISEPKVFVNKYSFMSVSVKNNFTGGADVIRRYESGDKTVAVSFFKGIETKTDWIENVVKKPTENYKLMNDIDFTGVADTAFCVTTFSGTLDGGNHTISNGRLSSKNALITNFYGTLQNIKFDNFYGPTFRTLLWTTGTTYLVNVNNVHISNFKMTYTTNATAGIAYTFNGIMSNCSANNIEFISTTTNNNSEFGGLVTILRDGGTIENSFVTNLNVDIETTSHASGTGGIVSSIQNGTVRNCYAQGSIKSDSFNIGGIAGNVAILGKVENCYSDVDIYSTDRTLIGSTTSLPAGGISGGGVGKVINCLSIGDLYCTVPQYRLARIIANRSYENSKTYLINSYGYKNQLINGYIDETWYPTICPTLLTFSDLKDAQTYTDIIQLGDAFDYSQVSQGFLPKLKDTNGNIMDYQSDLKIREDNAELLIDSVKVTENVSGYNAILEVAITHPKDFTLNTVRFKNDELRINSCDLVPTIDPTKSVVRIKVQPNKYFDNYTLESLTGNYDGKELDILNEVKVDLQFFKHITSFADWQLIDENSYENYLITNSIDFDGRSEFMKTNIKANRVKGVTTDGKNPLLSNIIFDINSATSKKNVFKAIKMEFSNIDIDNFVINRNDKYTPTINFVGFVEKMNGKAENINIRNMHLFNPEKGSKAIDINLADNVGFFSSASSYYTGIYKDITMDNIVIKGRNNLGALFSSYGGNVVTNSSFTNIDVEGSGNQVGGIRGSTSSAGYGIAHSYISNVKVKGGTNVGGLQSSVGYVYNCNISNVEVIGRDYVGGLVSYSRVYNNVVSNINVTGQKYVGGLVGNHQYADTFNNHLSDSTISATTKLDPSLIKLGITSLTSETGYYAGGISGGTTSILTYQFTENSVTNCTITGKQNVAAITGHTTGYARDNFVKKTTVEGESYVGGIVGNHDTYNLRDISNNYVQADISASSNGAGGIVGRLNNAPDAVGNHKTTINNNIFINYTKPLYAGVNAGGIVGIVEQNGKDVNWNGNILMGDIKSDSTIGITSGNSKNLAIFKNTLVLNTVKANDIVVEGPTLGTSNYKLVSKEELANKSTYTSLGYLEKTTNASTNNGSFRWDFDNINKDGKVYLPILYLRSYNGATAGVAGDYYSGYQAQKNNLIEIGSLSTRARSVALKDSQYIAYASDIDKVNIEFINGGDYSYYLNNDEKNIYKMNGNIITLKTNYQDNIDVHLMIGGEIKTITLNMNDFRNKTMLFDKDYFILDNENHLVTSHISIRGDFIHMYNGKLLTVDGNVIMIDKDENYSLDKTDIVVKTQPLLSYRFENKVIQSYGRYSLIDGQYRSLIVMCKNDRLYSIDGKLDMKTNQYIIDEYQDEVYETILGSDGRIYNLKDELRLPEGFKNEDISSMSQNINSNSHYVIFIYENGDILVCDYILGEVVYRNDVHEEISLFDFARGIFASRGKLISGDPMPAYESIQVLEDKLVETSIEELQSSLSESNKDDNNVVNDKDSNDSSDDKKTLSNITGKDKNNHSDTKTKNMYVSVYDSAKEEYVLYKTEDVLDTHITESDLETQNDIISKDIQLQNYYAVASTKLQYQSSIIGIVVFSTVIMLVLSGVGYLTYKKRKIN